MAIRASIGKAVPIVPFDVEWALRCCNNDLVYGQPNASPAALLEQAEYWENKGGVQLALGDDKKAGVYLRHSQRYLDAAAEVEKYDGRRAVRQTGRNLQRP